MLLEMTHSRPHPPPCDPLALPLQHQTRGPHLGHGGKRSDPRYIRTVGNNFHAVHIWQLCYSKHYHPVDGCCPWWLDTPYDVCVRHGHVQVMRMHDALLCACMCACVIICLATLSVVYSGVMNLYNSLGLVKLMSSGTWNWSLGSVVLFPPCCDPYQRFSKPCPTTSATYLSQSNQFQLQCTPSPATQHQSPPHRLNNPKAV